MVHPAGQMIRQTVLGLIVKMRKGNICYIGGCDMLPAPLSREEETDALERLAKGDLKARGLLIEHNLRLVVYIARKFENTGINIEDLISIGTIGLIKAVDTFNTEKKIKLATYASRCIAVLTTLVANAPISPRVLASSIWSCTACTSNIVARLLAFALVATSLSCSAVAALPPMVTFAGLIADWVVLLASSPPLSACGICAINAPLAMSVRLPVLMPMPLLLAVYCAWLSMLVTDRLPVSKVFLSAGAVLAIAPPLSWVCPLTLTLNPPLPA